MNVEILTRQDLQSAVSELQSALEELGREMRRLREERSSTPSARPVFLRTSEVCELLRCDKKTLARWQRRGLLRPAKVGARLLYREDEVVRLCSATD